MSYDHRTRLGNEGDLFKHVVLSRFIGTILKKISSTPIVYAESHSGRPLYQGLPQNGRWRFGIGPFSEAVQGKSASDFPNLQDYRKACFANAIVEGSDYYGSCGIVFNMLRRTGAPFSLHLWDTNTSVCQSLLSYFEDWPQVSVCRGDGYSGVQALPQVTLALIDPVSISSESEQKTIKKVLDHLTAINSAFICWTAIVDGDEEAAQAFEDMLRDDYAVEQVTWEPEEGSTRGCQITVPKGDWARTTHETLAETVYLMGGSFSLRSDLGS